MAKTIARGGSNASTSVGAVATGNSQDHSAAANVGNSSAANGASTGTQETGNVLPGAGAGNADTGTSDAASAEAARVAEEKRKKEDADRFEQSQRDAATALALAAQQRKAKKEIPALLITARAESFRRAGFRFGKEPLGIALECLTEDQIEQLKNEPNLIVEEVDALLDDLQITEAV